MKTTQIIKISLLLIAGLLIFASCTAPQPVAAQAMRGTGNGAGGQTDGSRLINNLPPSSTVALTPAEAAGLIFMREEEKLAHDVYVALASQWGLPLFENIAGSEQTHTDAVVVLLDRYGLSDPTVKNGVANGLGVFTDPTLQTLYDQLMAQGSVSLSAALTVGATIEDLDIVDLQSRIAQTDKTDIQLVYENLLRGSGNHLRAFTKTLTQQAGVTYQPQYLDQVAYAAIVNAAPGRGQGRGQSRDR